MNFLEAKRLVDNFEGGEPLPFLLALSGTPDKLDVFLSAAAAMKGRRAEVRTLPFNTLSQWLFGPQSDETEVVLVLPWDFVPEADWRSGVPLDLQDEETIRARAQATADRIARRRDARVLYLPAPMPPLFSASARNAALEAWLLSLAAGLGAEVLPADAFSLGSYLANGSPFAGPRLMQTAAAITQAALRGVSPSRKVLVTDLDNVMWHGVIGEDGLEGIRCAPEGIGFRFFLYQTLLARLEAEGVLLAAVSRNSDDLARAPFRAGRLVLSEKQFVCIVATYSAKSAQIAQIAGQLDLGLDAFVFVDDNPLELAEVTAQLPAVECVEFPLRDDGLPGFLARLTALFPRSSVTAEDRERTEMYRRRLAGMAPSDLDGSDLTSFLQDLEMRLEVVERTRGDRARAVQLINKTNQFNLNGRRVTDDEIEDALSAGGRLFTASLRDRNGSHGEILACVVTPEGVIRSLVMSCRVLQRRVEFAFLAWLAQQQIPVKLLDFEATQRNEPFRNFLRQAGVPFREDTPAEMLPFDAQRFHDEHGVAALRLFRVEAIADAAVLTQG